MRLFVGRRRRLPGTGDHARSDIAAAYLPLVQGVNDVSEKMLTGDGGLFDKVHTGMANAGGIDDQAFSAYSRGGVRYIGEVPKAAPEIESGRGDAY